jgi:hypothetical protein
LKTAFLLSAIRVTTGVLSGFFEDLPAAAERGAVGLEVVIQACQKYPANTIAQALPLYEKRSQIRPALAQRP